MFLDHNEVYFYFCAFTSSYNTLQSTEKNQDVLGGCLRWLDSYHILA